MSILVADKIFHACPAGRKFSNFQIFKFLTVILGVLFLTTSCRDRDKHGRILDTPTSGEITIAVDESLRPLVDAEVSAFEGIYQQAKIHVIYLSESEAIHAMLVDTARLAVVRRKLTTEEALPLTQQNIVPAQISFAIGAIAIISNKDNPVDQLSLEQLKNLLTGQITTWRQVDPKADGSGIQIVFDNPTSGIVSYLKDSIAQVKALSSNCFAVDSNAAVIDYVSKNKNALGVIGAEWISDHDSVAANQFLSSVKVVKLGSDTSAVQPFQAYIALHQYPLTRKTFVLSREARTGLGSGFLSFIASDKGQRIVLKAGLVPSTMPVRIIEFNSDKK